MPPLIGAGKEAIANDLPVVELPKLDGAEAIAAPDSEAAGETPSEPAAAPLAAAAPASQPRSFRFALLAATIALAAAIGSFVGSLTASGIARRAPAEAAIPKTADARDVVQALKAQLAELSVLKAGLDGANRSANTQFTKIAERLDSLERAQADPAAKLARIAEAVDRLDKRAAAAPEITGSIASPPAAAAPAPEPNVAAPVLHDWVVQDVRNGRALVESRYGSEFVVGSGSVLPGLGRVEEVKRQDGEWVVVTAKGVITSGR